MRASLEGNIYLLMDFSEGIRPPNTKVLKINQVNDVFLFIELPSLFIQILPNSHAKNKDHVNVSTGK